MKHCALLAVQGIQFGAAGYGIGAARQQPGHRDISTTSAHYMEKKKRVEITLSTAGGKLREVAS